MFKRIFLIVLDSLGVGQTSDADKFGDDGANTLGHILEDRNYNLDILEKLGLTNLIGAKIEKTRGYYMKAKPMNLAKDTLNGHYEMMGVIADAYKTYPDGFPLELISEIQKVTGRDVIGNIASSGTEIIEKLGEMHMKTGSLIIYTSADSVLQIAAHEHIIPLNELYDICKKVRELTNNNKYKIARIIARPFTGKNGEFVRTSNRHDYALDPPLNDLDLLDKAQIKTIAIGKISDIFNGKGISSSVKTKNNIDGMLKLIDFSKADFKGFVFANLNDFDSLYGHRRDKDGYLKALEEFNYYLPIFLKNIKNDDLVILCADHGNDPTFKGTDHTRENVPVILYSPSFKTSGRLSDRNSFADIGATILHNFGVDKGSLAGESIFGEKK